MSIALCRVCRTPAACALTFDYGDRVVFLDDLVTAVEPGGIELCTAHGDGRTAPVGWSLADRRRGGDRSLFIALDVA